MTHKNTPSRPLMILRSIGVRHVIPFAAGVVTTLLGVYCLNGVREPEIFPDQPNVDVKETKTLRKSSRVTNERFLENLSAEFVLPDDSDDLGHRILQDYGAIFVAHNSVKKPTHCVFVNETEVQEFQKSARFVSATLGGTTIYLQPAAMEALLAAREQARKMDLDITPRGGSEAARRSYADTVRLWFTRVLPALDYWQRRGRLSSAEAGALRQLPPEDQVPRVLELEKRGLYFSKDVSKSILYSIAAPGTSQHISMLALDVSQFGDERVRNILAQHGWFQTVYSDLPHFTYLGLKESELPERGLHPVRVGNQVFWIPLLTELTTKHKGEIVWPSVLPAEV